MSLPIASYASTLQHAQKAFDASQALLKAALADKTVEGSVAHQVDQLDAQVKTMSEAKRPADTYADLAAQFVKFMAPQLDKYETAQKAKAEGLKAIEAVKAAQATCTAFKPTPQQKDAFMHHMVGLGMKVSKYEGAQKAADEKIGAYPFAAQIAELTDAVAKVTTQLTVLEGSLDKAFYTKKSAEGKAGLLDMIPSYNHSYLLAAIAEKNKPVVVETPKVAVSTVEKEGVPKAANA